VDGKKGSVSRRAEDVTGAVPEGVFTNTRSLRPAIGSIQSAKAGEVGTPIPLTVIGQNVRTRDVRLD